MANATLPKIELFCEHCTQAVMPKSGKTLPFEEFSDQGIINAFELDTKKLSCQCEEPESRVWNFRVTAETRTKF